MRACTCTHVYTYGCVYLYIYCYCCSMNICSLLLLKKKQPSLRTAVILLLAVVNTNRPFCPIGIGIIKDIILDVCPAIWLDFVQADVPPVQRGEDIFYISPIFRGISCPFSVVFVTGKESFYYIPRGSFYHEPAMMAGSTKIKNIYFYNFHYFCPLSTERLINLHIYNSIL